MKKTTCMLALMISILPIVAMAQSNTHEVMAKVPFAFNTGNRSLPAGDYTLLVSGSALQTAMIRNFDAKISLYTTVSSRPAPQSASTALIFHKYGDRYFLSGVRLGNSTVTYAVNEGKAEKELRAQNVPETDQVLLASVQ